LNMAKPMPAIFFGHGNPMNALEHNAWTEGWAALGAKMPRPKAVLCISAHWYLPDTRVTSMRAPRTIHDFAGFPPALRAIKYPAPGDPNLASRIKTLLAPLSVTLDKRWGLDHGTWSVLCHVFPKANIPVLQLSIDETQPALFHYELGKRLSSLRDRGVLIVGSGNLVHNLHAYGWGRREIKPFDWAMRFEQRVRELLSAGDHDPLIAYDTLGRDAALSVPTPDHYLPLLYVIAQQRESDEVSFPVEGFDGGSVSMLSVKIG
jgi:4,5-DOPA dioxygenase extradiol